MSITRTWIFPIIRMILVAAIAAALVKLAFFNDSATETSTVEPTGVIMEPNYVITRGTIVNNLTAKATVVADPAVPAVTTAAGTVNKIYVEVGTQVAAGDVLFDIRIETPQEPLETKDPEGNVTVTERKPLITYTEIAAPISGTVSSLSVLPKQTTSIGDVSAKIAPPTFSVVGSLDAAQRYRLSNQPTEATVTIANGPAPFTCSNLRITTPLAGSETDPNANAPAANGSNGGGQSTGNTTLTCSVPAEITVFSGLSAEIVIAGGQSENVLVAPTTSVRGSAQNGIVWFLLPDGTSEERNVTLGLTDGTSVEIIEGVAEGDSILQFVPGAVNENQDQIMMGSISE